MTEKILYAIMWGILSVLIIVLIIACVSFIRRTYNTLYVDDINDECIKSEITLQEVEYDYPEGEFYIQNLSRNVSVGDCK